MNSSPDPHQVHTEFQKFYFLFPKKHKSLVCLCVSVCFSPCFGSVILSGSPEARSKAYPLLNLLFNSDVNPYGLELHSSVDLDSSLKQTDKV